MDEVKPLSLAVAMGLVLDLSGALHVYGLADAQSLTREAASAMALLVIAGLWLAPRPAWDGAAPARAPFWVTVLPLIAAVFAISDVLTFVSRGWTPARLAIFGTGAGALLVLALRRAPGALIAAVALALGIALRLLHIKHMPLDPSRGDMLPLVQQALGNLFRGQSPYTTYAMPWELPLTYLPLTWLAYAPGFMLGIDPRWTNVVAEFAVLGAAMFVTRHLPRERGRPASDTTLLLWAWLFLSPTIIRWDMVTSAPIGWAAIAWTLALVVTGRRRGAAIALGLAGATTPLIAVALPLIALCWWREGGTAETIRKGALAAIVAGVLLLPWFVWAPGPFLDGSVRWFNDLDRFPRMKWQTERTWAEITGFSGFFWEWGREAWLKPIQAVVVALVAALYAARGAARPDLPRHATAALLLFTLFNPVLWPYLYNPALVAALLAVASTGLVSPVPVVAWRGETNLTSRPPSLLGKGENGAPPLVGEGLGER